jgi:hypothetical protein
MAIIRTNAVRPGWSTARQVSQFLTCDLCGAVCAEGATEPHERWHADLELRMLPRLGAATIVTTLIEPRIALAADLDADLGLDIDDDIEQVSA